MAREDLGVKQAVMISFDTNILVSSRIVHRPLAVV
jgi:hypothetical protein